jgi:hypothetical protein
MKQILKIISFVIIASSALIAQDNYADNYGTPYFGKPFYKNAYENQFEYYDPITTESSKNVESSLKELKLTNKNIIGRKMIFDYDLFSFELVVNSDSTLSLKSGNSKNFDIEKTRTIYIDNHTILKSWSKSEDNSMVTVYADFAKRKTHAFLYKNNGEVELANGLIKLKD